MSVLSVKSVKKGFKTPKGFLQVLKDVNLEVIKGESVAVVGRSGSGKSTLLSLLCGLERADEGTIALGQTAYHSLDETQMTQLRARDIGMVFQQFHLLAHLTALENVSLPLELQNDPQAREKARTLLNEVGLSDRVDHFPAQLSGGEQQRVAIARALSIEPNVILADEPSGSLDEATGEDVMELLFRIVKDHKKSLLIVTHSTSLAARCDRTVVMESGVLKG